MPKRLPKSPALEDPRAATARENGKLGGRPAELENPVKTAIVVAGETIAFADEVAARRGVKRAAILRQWIEAGAAAEYRRTKR